MTERALLPWIVQGGVLKRRGYADDFLFTVGVTQPTSDNAGASQSFSFTTHSGDWVITDNNVTIEYYWIEGLVDLQGSGITFQYNVVVSRDISSYPGFDALVRSSGTGNTIQLNTLTQYDWTTQTDNSIYYVVGVKLTGGTATVFRNDISNCNDLVYITGGTQTVIANYLHDPSFRTDDADQSANMTHPYWSHNDGVQVRGGANHVIWGNSIEMKFSTVTGMNSTVNSDPGAEQIWPNCHGILMEPAASALTGVTIKENWFKFGACAIHYTQNTYAGNTATQTANRVTPDQSKEFSVYTQIRIDPTTVWTVTDSDNVYSNDSDTPEAWRGVALKSPTTSGTTKVWQFNSSSHTP